MWQGSWTFADGLDLTSLIVAMLGLAIGMTTIGFSFADTALLRGLPIAEPERTVIVYGVNAAEPDRRGGVFFSDILDLRERARSVEQWSTWAQVRDVAGLVLAQAARVLAVGLIPGLAGGVLAASALRRVLYGVTPLDPLNLIGVTALLTLVSVVASVAPALRASRVNVIEIIRSQ